MTSPCGHTSPLARGPLCGPSTPPGGHCLRATLTAYSVPRWRRNGPAVILSLAMNSPRRPVKRPASDDGLPSPEWFADARARLERMALDPRYAYLLDPATIERNRGR